MYNEYLINKMVDAELKKYAKYHNKQNKSNLDKLEAIQRYLEMKCETKIREKNYHYTKEITEINNVMNLIQKRFDYYFKVGNFYAWINGNNNYKNLTKS